MCSKIILLKKSILKKYLKRSIILIHIFSTKTPRNAFITLKEFKKLLQLLEVRKNQSDL